MLKIPSDLDNFGKDWVYEPLEIVFHIGTPMVLTHPFVAFDSLVLHLYAKSYYREDYAFLPSNQILRDDLLPSKLRVPLLKHKSGMYYGSFTVFDEDITTLARFHMIRRRFEDRYLQYMKPVKKIGINKGTLKNYQMKIVQISPKYVRFYCFGVKSILDELFTDLHGLGKKVNTGNGSILSFKINSIKDDRSWVHNGIAQRAIPVRLLKKTSHQCPMTWIPPYWARDMIEVCAPPGASVELYHHAF